MDTNYTDPPTVPEPSTLMLLVAGGALLWPLALRRGKQTGKDIG
jgi:hypothetical protein